MYWNFSKNDKKGILLISNDLSGNPMWALLNFEDKCLIPQSKLSLQDMTTTGYRTGIKSINVCIIWRSMLDLEVHNTNILTPRSGVPHLYEMGRNNAYGDYFVDRGSGYWSANIGNYVILVSNIVSLYVFF